MVRGLRIPCLKHDSFCYQCKEDNATKILKFNGIVPNDLLKLKKRIGNFNVI